MVIDLATFEVNKHFIQEWFKNKGNYNVNYTISMMASATSVPCIVIAFWLGEITNWCPSSVAAIKRLKDFYGYTEIKNKPEGSP